MLINKLYHFMCKIFYWGKYRDVTGVKLNPNNPFKCRGNGDYKGIEICCDNCDYYMGCMDVFYPDGEYSVDYDNFHDLP